MKDENIEALSAAGGGGAGSILGGLLGGKIAAEGIKAKVAKTQGQRDIRTARHQMREVEAAKDMKSLKAKLEGLKGADRKFMTRTEGLARKAKKVGRGKGALLGVGAGLLTGLGVSDAILRRNRDGHN